MLPFDVPNDKPSSVQTSTTVYWPGSIQQSLGYYIPWYGWIGIVCVQVVVIAVILFICMRRLQASKDEG